MGRSSNIFALIYLLFIVAILLGVVIMMNGLKNQLLEERGLNDTLLLNLNMVQDVNEELLKENNNLKETIRIMDIKLKLCEDAKAIVVPAVVTAYAPFDNQSGICADDNPTVTSRGYTPSKVYAAADPERLPYGSKLIIPGYGEVEVQDTGSALRADPDNIRIDVYFDTHEEAIRWGRRNLDIQIVL